MEINISAMYPVLLEIGLLGFSILYNSRSDEGRQILKFYTAPEREKGVIYSGRLNDIFVALLIFPLIMSVLLIKPRYLFMRFGPAYAIIMMLTLFAWTVIVLLRDALPAPEFCSREELFFLQRMYIRVNAIMVAWFLTISYFALIRTDFMMK